MDEGLRSATGAPDLNGFYVERLCIFSRLKKYGIMKNDVLISVDGNIFTGSKQDFTNIFHNGRVEVIRQQKQILL